MMRRLALVQRTVSGIAAICLANSCLGAQLRVESHLEASAAPVVGETVLLHVDVLTDTWFSTPPQMPVLELANATVSAPSGEARHLNVSLDGTPFFGLQFSYRITPTSAGDFLIEPMLIVATPGQSDTQQTARTAPLEFKVQQIPGAIPGQSTLAARELTLSQKVIKSHDVLGLGDSVRREVKQTASGAEMMLIVAPVFPEIDGLKRYVEPPQLKVLDDGRGNISGGERLDTVHYIVERSGEFKLPIISIKWWDSGSQQMRSAELPSIQFTANDTVFLSPFSVSEDLKLLGQHGRINLTEHVVALSLGGIALGMALYFCRPWVTRSWMSFQQLRAHRRQQWIDSPHCARLMIPEQLHARPPRLDALYLWVHRQYGATGLAAIKDRVPSDMTRLVYGRERHLDDALKSLELSLRSKQPSSARLHFDRRGLQPLNPRHSATGKRSMSS